MKRSRSLAAMGAAALLSSAALSSPSSAAASSVASRRATEDRGHRPRHRRRAQTELASPAESAASNAASTGAADDTDYHPSHALCPGYEERQLRGYATLAALRHDLELYYASFDTATPTGAPTSSNMPTTATKHPTIPPTLEPSVSPIQSPTSNPTGSPSELPTKAPITLRPTPFPTSSIREEKAPTNSPAPSIEMVIVGLPGGGGGGDVESGEGGGEGGEEGELNWNIPPPENVPIDAPVDTNGGVGEGMDGGAVFVGGPGGSYTGEVDEETPMEGKDEMMGEDADDGAGGMGEGGMGGRERRLGDPTNVRRWRRLQDSGTGMAADATDSQVIVEEGMAEEVAAAADGAAAPMTVDGEVAMTAAADEGKLDYTLSNESPSDGGLVAATSENAAIPTASEDIPPVSFQLCPNSDFDFHDKFSLQGTLPPLRLETPSEGHPIEVRCMVIEGEEERNCVFRGGDVHLLFAHRPKLNDGDGGGEEGEEGAEIGGVEHPITVRGITFRDAQTSSIRMNDPRGRVAFRNCAWEGNGGTAAVVIDGRFNSTQHVMDDAQNDGGNGGQEGGGATEDGKPNTNNDGSNGGNGGGAEVDEELSTTSSTLDWSIMMTSSTKGVDLLVEPDEELFSTMTGSTTPARGRGLEYSNDEEELAMYGGREEEMMAMEDVDGMGDGMRRLEAADVPRSIVTVEGCAFKGNRGNATIMVSSRFEKQTLAEQDPGVLTHNDDLLNGDADSDGGGRGRHLEGDEGSTTPLAHTVHLMLRDTTFSSGVVDTSVIENYGGRVQSSGCVFANNTAESIIRSESGTVAMSSTEFGMNVITGKEGMVVLDEASALERDEDTCIRGTSDSSGGAAAPSSAASGGESPSVAKNASGTRMDSFNGARRLNGTAVEGGASGIRCEGIVSGGMCTSFALCKDQEASDSTSNETSSPEMAESSCFSDWEALVAAVRDRPKNERDFIICPGAALVATKPVVIDADYITIQCGTEKAPSKNCIITGGFSHFHVVGSSSGVQLARLSMSSSTGASILALGTADATLNLRDCEWTHNEGASAILIRNEEGLGAAVAGGGMQELVIMPMLAKAGGRAMAVEVADCVFGKNDLTFGAIANVGGTLSVYKSKFAENSGRGGDIVVTNAGSCTVQGSCFDASSSVAPGVIFVQEGSVMNANNNNVGFGITAGGYAGEGTCTDAFLEVEGADCLGSSNCDGICLGFTATVCPVDVSGDESILGMADAGGGEGSGGGAGELAAAPEGQIFVPAYSRSEGSDGSSKIVPIVVAAIVCVFIVLGLVGIIVRRRKVASNNDVSPANDEPSSRGFCCCLKGRGAKRRESSAYEDVDDEGNDVFDEDNVA